MRRGRPAGIRLWRWRVRRFEEWLIVDGKAWERDHRVHFALAMRAEILRRILIGCAQDDTCLVKSDALRMTTFSEGMRRALFRGVAFALDGELR